MIINFLNNRTLLPPDLGCRRPMRDIKISQAFTNSGQDSLHRYLKDIAGYTLLTVDDEVNLARRIKAGDEAALQKLIKANLRFVVSVAKKFEGHGILLADLVAVGNMGLIKAARRFDETRGFKFISFAVWWIRQAMTQMIGEQKRMIRLPMNRVEDIAEVRKIQLRLEQQLERVPIPDEIAEHTGISLDKVLTYINDNPYCSPLYAGCDETEFPGLLNFLEDTSFDAPDEHLNKEGLSENIQVLMKFLDQRERLVLKLIFGLDGKEPMAYEEIAAQLSLSKEYVRRIKTIAFKTLRAKPEVQHLRQYLK